MNIDIYFCQWGIVAILIVIVLYNNIVTVSIISNMIIVMYTQVVLIWISLAAANTSTGIFLIHILELIIATQFSFVFLIVYYIFTFQVYVLLRLFQGLSVLITQIWMNAPKTWITMSCAKPMQLCRMETVIFTSTIVANLMFSNV